MAPNENPYPELAYYPQLREYVARMLGNWHDADDIVQETSLRYYRVSREIPIGYVRAWMYRTARNLIIDLYRHRSSEELTLDEQAVNHFLDIISRNEQKERVRKQFEDVSTIVGTFSLREQEIFRLRIEEGLKGPEIAYITQTTPENVRQIFCTIVKKLRNHKREIES